MLDIMILIFDTFDSNYDYLTKMEDADFVMLNLKK